MLPETDEKAAYESALDSLCFACGISTEYWDISGVRHPASTETKRVLLEALGVAAGTLVEVQAAGDRLKREEWRRVLPPCLVVSASAPIEIPVRLPKGHASRGSLQIVTEDGQTTTVEIDLATLPIVASFEEISQPRPKVEKANKSHAVNNVVVKRLVPINVPLPLGYHRFRLTFPGSRDQPAEIYESSLIIAPDKAFVPAFLADSAEGAEGKAAGIALTLYGLRSSRNWGCGDCTDLMRAINWVSRELRADFIALNPLHAIHNRRPYNTSPYLPNSVYYRNPIYLDVEVVPGFHSSPRIRRLWAKTETQGEIADLRGAEFVEYERVYSLKLRFLRIVFIEFQRAIGENQAAYASSAAEFQNFVVREGALLDRFATYCALDNFLHARNPDLWIWTDWPKPYQDPESPETRAFQQRHRRAILFHKWLQWHLDKQLAACQQHACEAGLRIGLYHDLALATDRFGSDLWAHAASFVKGCRVGAPPDDFSPDGQDWAFPPPDSRHHRADGYRLFTESIRKTLRHGGALRLDHVMRFFRLFWIPDGMSAAQGTYVNDRAEDLVRILALESIRNQVLVVGEDLGTVEPYIRETLEKFGVLSYRLLYFEREYGGVFKQPASYPRQALVSSTTHDLPTITGFWTGADIEARKKANLLDGVAYGAQWEDRIREKGRLLAAIHQAGLLPAGYPRDASELKELDGTLHHAVIGFLASTPSMLLAVNQEDLTKEPSQQNLPGTTWQYPNWGRKMRFSLEQLETDSEALGISAMFRNWLIQTGRVKGGGLSDRTNSKR